MTTTTENAKDTTYNGWTNYETWRVNLEFFDGDHWNDRAAELAQEKLDNGDDLDDLASDLADEMRESLENYIDENSSEGLARDYAQAFISDANYMEIARHACDDIRAWSAGFNMPGYMPDSEPGLFLDWDAARDSLVEELERAADELEEGADASDYESAVKALISQGAANTDQGFNVGNYHYFLTRVFGS